MVFPVILQVFSSIPFAFEKMRESLTMNDMSGNRTNGSQCLISVIALSGRSGHDDNAYHLPARIYSWYFGPMVDAFSPRARQIIFAARFKAGERGAKMIDTNDFLVGLVLEDQGWLERTFFSKILGGEDTFVNNLPSHVPFFPSKMAEELLANLENVLPQSQPIALNTEVPLSPSLGRVFDTAKALQARFQHTEIEPLHFLAAILTEESGQGAKLLQDYGITQEKVLLRLSGASEN
jgi:hypothetical protein